MCAWLFLSLYKYSINSTDKCVYNGVAYSQGQRWDDGCDLECVCENAIYGFYRCNKKYVKYSKGTKGCILDFHTYYRGK